MSEFEWLTLVTGILMPVRNELTLEFEETHRRDQPAGQPTGDSHGDDDRTVEQEGETGARGRRYRDGTTVTTDQRTETTIENHRPDAPGQRGQPGAHPGHGRGPGEADAGNPARNEGWIESVLRGMTERRQHRWFLTRKAVDALYVTDHRHPNPREEARAVGLAELHPHGRVANRLHGNASPWTTTTRPTWRTRTVRRSPSAESGRG